MENKFKKLKFVIVIAIFTLLLGVIGSIWLSKNVVSIYFDEANAEFEYIKKFLKENEEVNNYIIKYGSKVYENATKNLAYLFREGISGDIISKDELVELSKEAQVDNIIIVDNEGNVKNSIENTIFDFKDSKYDELRTIFDGSKKSTMLSLFNNGVTDYYFAAKINDNLEVIIYCDGRKIGNDDYYTTSWASVMLDKGQRKTFNFFVLEKGGDKVIYNSNDSYIGKNLVVNNNSLNSENFNLVKLFDKWGFAKKMPLENVDLVSFIYLNSVMKGPIIYMLFTLLAFLLCIIFIAVYSAVVSEEANLIKEGFSETIDKVKHEKIRKKKIYIISLVSIVMMSLAMLFFSNIYCISVADEGTTYYSTKIKNFAYRSKENTDPLNLMCESYCKINNDFICMVLQKYPSKLNREDLSKMVKSLEVSEIRILDLNGETVCTSNGLDKYKLSKDKEDDSFKCWDLLNRDDFIMLPISQDVKGNVYQYVCSTLRDENYDISGIVMTKYDMKEKQDVENLVDWYEYSRTALDGEDMFYFMFDDAKNEFVATSKEDIIHKKVEDVEFTSKAIQGGYEGFINFKGDKLFGKTIQIDKIAVGLFLSLKMINNYIKFDIILLMLFVMILIILYMFIAIHLSKDYKIERIVLDMQDTNDANAFSVNRRFVTDWSMITGTQKISLLIFYLFIVIMIIFSIILLYGDKIFGENSIIYYIINGDWDHSLNVLAFSKCILLISFILLIALITNKLLEILSNGFDSRGVTICRLLANFVRYAAIFVALYQCLSMIGVDAKTLVASAGILSLVIGFGANKLIQEVVSGLFIIFEGSFQVGDTISIGGGFTGIVREIGIRNTKIASLDGNVMIISNSHLDSVVNHSTAKTLIVYEYKIPKTILLDDCDEFFNSKISYLKEKLGNIVKEIKYDGIVVYEADSYTIRFSIFGVEESKAKIEYMIDGEMKLLVKELSDKV